MDFYSAYGERPVRLCEATRQFADDSLRHRYGLDTQKTPCIVMDDEPGFEAMTPLEQQDLSIRRIVERAPIRICEGERLSGSATLGDAVKCCVPVTLHGKHILEAVSHLTVTFEEVLKIGINGIRRRAEAALARYRGTEREPFARSVLSCLDSFAIYHRRYLEALRGRPEYAANYQNLLCVPMEPPENFYQAVQSIWFVFSFIRLCGSWPGIGRLDVLLGDYLKRELAADTLSLDEAREILAHFFIKGCEWVRGGSCGSGDGQHYQNIILGGIGDDGKEVTNEVTYLVLDILEELNIGDFPTTVRLNRETPEKLVERVCEVIRYGGGTVAVYNEELVLKALTDFGYSREEAVRFANDGCWEVQIPGRTNFGYIPFDALQVLQHMTLKDYGDDVTFASFEALYAAFLGSLSERVQGIVAKLCRQFAGRNADGTWKWNPQLPCTVVSLFEADCIGRGLSYYEGGAVYNVRSPHIGGIADTVNSLYAIKKLVFDDRVISFAELMQTLRNNWAGAEPLRLYAKNHYRYYGNDSGEADELYRRLVHDFAECCRQQEGQCGYRLPAGISTFGRQLEWREKRLACAHGTKAGDILAGNASPTPGTDGEGATAVICSYCRAELSEMTTGAALDLKLLPSVVKGDTGLQAMVALLRGFVRLGGFFLQLDVADAKILHEAQAHPEDYQTLSVRVSGWNARFVTLDRGWQQMIIEQMEK